jgi:acetyl esterase/lipase
MPLDPRAQRLLHMLSVSASGSPAETADDRRRSLASLTASVGGAAPDVPSVTDLEVPGAEGAIRLRRYQLDRVDADGSATGAILFLHGGGWVAGDLDTHDGVCRRLAMESGCQVFAVDYRLAPEHPFPAGLEDASAALAWLASHARMLNVAPGKLVVAGDSAGGNLAAAACLMARDAGGPAIALQLLICPILDLAEESPSRRAFAKGYFLSSDTMARDLTDYLPRGADLRDPRLSPLHAMDVAGAPPTQIHVAEFDPFRDEGLAFARRLEAVGVPVSSTLHPGMIHYFYAMPGAIPYARQALQGIGAAVRAALAD